MSLTGMYLPSPSIGQESSPRVKRPTALRVVGRLLTLVAIWGGATVAAHAQDYTFTTLAGVAGSSGYNNSNTGSSTNTPFFNGPGGVVVDSSGNYFVADGENHTIRKVTPAGVVTTFAGTGGLAGNVDGTGNAARFTVPRGPAIDSAGNIYVADYGSNVIRKITPAGVVTSLAGFPGSSGTVDGTGTAALFSGPSSVAVDSAGNIYVADSFNNQIRKVTSAGVVTVFAGSTVAAIGTTDGTGTAALFSRPRGVAVDSAGNVYVADSNNNTIRKITPAQVVTTIAGTAGKYGNTDAAVATDARFDFPCSLAFDAAGNLFIADQANHTIRKLSTSGAVTTVAGQAGISGAVDDDGIKARFYAPSGVACDSSGNIVVTDYGNQLVRRVSGSAPNHVTTVAGVAGIIGVQDGTGYLLIAPSLFAGPSATAPDATGGTIYVADTKNQVIRKVSATGVTGLFAGLVGTIGSSDTDVANGVVARFWNPAGIAVDKVVSGNVIVADTGNHLIRVITPAGVVSTLAGSVQTSGNTDGTGTAARFNSPSSVTVDNSGNIYVADYGNHSIRLVTPAGVVSTFAGSGTAGSADGTGTSASFKFPRGIAIDSTGTALYVADTENHIIRKIDIASRAVTTVAGSAGSASSKDATGTAARFNSPNSVAVSSSGVIYVADTENETIRAISPGGAVTTIASLPGRIGSVDGIGQAVRFNQPTGISVDSNDTIYVADARNNTIRRGVSSAGKGGSAGGYDGGSFDNSGNGGTGGGGGGGTTPTGNGLLLHPGGIAIDTAGNIYVTDTANNSIKKITIGSDGQGTVGVLAGKDGTAGTADGTGTAASFNGPTGIVNDGSNNFYVTDTGNATIRKVTPAGVVTTFAGSSGKRGNQDGLGTAALFSTPAGIEVDSEGNLYVADSTASTIRKISTLDVTTTTPTTPAGTVTTFAGLAMTAGDADGTGTAARFNNPTGVAVDTNGNLYVADTNNNTIRWMNLKVSTDGTRPAATVTTWAGASGISGSFDGNGNYALFSNPTGLAASHSSAGSLVVADTGNNLIRLISGGASVTTYAGIAGIAGYRDDVRSSALFNQPKAVAIGGGVLVADTGNSSIRIVAGSAVTGLILKKPTDTSTGGSTGDSTGGSTGSSSGGGNVELWFASLALLLLFQSSRSRSNLLR